MRKLLLSAATLLALSVSAHAEEKNLDFTLNNATGYDIKAVMVDPESSNQWSGNILQDPTLKNGEGSEVTFSGEASTCNWDLRVDWADDYQPVAWKGLDLCNISEITLKYDRNSGETTAELK